MVLIDGDGTIFNDKLLAKGEAGGKDAAAYLWSSVSQFVHERIPDLATDYKIVTRVYANLKGLGDVCQRAGLVETPAVINDFARGFTGSKQLFDFVDVGVGKDRADDKISGNIPQSPSFLLQTGRLMTRQKYSNCIFTILIADTYYLAAHTTTATPGYSKMSELKTS